MKLPKLRTGHVAFLFSEPIVFPPNGTDLKSFYVSQELLRRSVRVTWISISEKYHAHKIAGIDVIGIGLRRKGFAALLLAFIRMQILFRVDRINCVYDFDWAFLREHPLRRLILQLMCKLSRVRYVLVQDDPLIDYEIAYGYLIEGSQRHRSLMRIYAVIYRLADLIILPSRAYVDVFVKRGIPEHKLLGEFQGIDRDRFNPSVMGKQIRTRLDLQNKFVVGWFGHMDPYRRIREVIIPCIETLSRDIPNVHFVIAGRGELRNDFVRARQGEYGMYFTLLDFIPNHELPAYYAACDMTISPLDTQYVHTRNTISTKVIESIAVGKPIVATRTRAISYDYRDLKGVLWTGDDLRSFHHSIVEMYENCEFYTQQARIQSDEMGRFLKEFTSSEIVNAMAKVCSF